MEHCPSIQSWQFSHFRNSSLSPDASTFLLWSVYLATVGKMYLHCINRYVFQRKVLTGVVDFVLVLESRWADNIVKVEGDAWSRRGTVTFVFIASSCVCCGYTSVCTYWNRASQAENMLHEPFFPEVCWDCFSKKSGWTIPTFLGLSTLLESSHKFPHRCLWIFVQTPLILRAFDEMLKHIEIACSYLRCRIFSNLLSQSLVSMH